MTSRHDNAPRNAAPWILAVVPFASGCAHTISLGIPELGLMIQWVTGGVLWAVANVVYFDRKRKGIRGFTRFIAFWAGTPTTWITFFALPEGHVDLVEPPPDDEQALLREVRHDRALRVASERAPVDASSDPSEADLGELPRAPSAQDD